MIRFTFILIVFFQFNFGFSQVQAYEIGDIVNDFTATDIHGNTYNLYDECESGKYVYIKFFTTNCSYCQYITPFFNEFYEKYGCGNGEISCVSVNGQTDNAGVLAFDQTYSGGFPSPPAISIDGGSAAIISRYLPNSYPTLCVISPDKKLFLKRIWPVSGVESFENVFTETFNPQPQQCNLSITENSLNLELNVYPNPINDFFYISSRGLNINDPITINIYNNLSQRISSLMVNTEQKIFFKAPNGLYFLEIKTKNLKYYKNLFINAK